MITLIFYDLIISYLHIFVALDAWRTTFCVFLQVVSKNWCPMKLDILTEAEVTAVLRAFQKGKKFSHQDRDVPCCTIYPSLSIFVHPLWRSYWGRLWYVVINPMCQSQGGVERCWKAVVNGFQARNPAWMTCLSFIVWMHRDIYIWRGILHFFFTWNQHHIQDQENNIKNYLTSSDPHRDKLFCRSFWHLIWKYIYGIYFLTFASGILSDILFWHPIWHSFWHLFWHSLWHGHWDLELAVEVWQRPLRPGSAHWAPELARQCPQSSGAGSCDPRPNKEGRNEGWKEKVPLIKSRDRHLAGWELTSRIKQIAKQIDRHEAKKKHIAPQRLAYSCCAIADFVSLETQGSQICTFPWKSILCKKR